MKACESSLDKPKEGLDKAVWTDDQPPVLTPQAQAVVDQVVAHAVATFKIPQFKLHIIGSITSNQWTETTDIDLHFYCPTFNKDKADEFNKLFRAWFKDVYVAGGYVAKIAEHPIELYMQPNEVQDYMSVGCYDVLEKRWEVGPELAPLDYNPIASWWNIDMKAVEELVAQMRDVILRCYESAKALLQVNVADQSFDAVANELAKNVQEAAQLLKDAKEARKIASEPTTKEQALALRNSEEWKIADTSFKLLDKYGYLAVLKSCSEVKDRFQEDASDMQMAAKEILASIDKNISPTKNLVDSQKELDEGFKEAVFSIAALASIFSAEGVADKATLQSNMQKIPKYELKIDSKAFKDAMKKSTTLKSYNGLNATNLMNVVARTIYAEGKAESDEGRAAIASVIWNRSGGDPANFVKVISRREQFSCWNKYTGGWTDSTYTPFPSTTNAANEVVQNAAVWSNCKDLASQMVNMTFTSTIGNKNLYLNKARASQKALNTWGKLCTYKIGRHEFGYAKDQDGFLKAGKAAQNKVAPNKTGIEYVVKSGDTLWSIARAYKTSVDAIKANNKDIDDKHLQIGQKILI